MKRTKIALVSMVLAVCLLSSALALVMYQRSVGNQMSLSASYDIGVYEHDTTTDCLNIVWGAFTESQVKTYVIDLKYLGNVQGRIYWDASNLNGVWVVTVEEKNHDASGYNIWLSGENNQITGLEFGHLKHIRLTLTEVNAVPNQQYAFSVAFYSIA